MNKPIILLSFSLLIVLSTNTRAQDGPQANERLPEEITVKSAPPLTSIQREINQAQKEMFLVFNELNDDDEFDIYCKYIERTGTRIRQPVCMANFFMTAQVQEAEFALSNFGYAGLRPSGPGALSVGYKFDILQEKMEAIFIESPEFTEKVNTYNGLLEKYDEQMKKNFDKF